MEEQNKKERRKILITGIVSLILIICIVGYTYSYFVVKDTDNITITGTVASGELEIEVNQLAPTDTYQNKGLIPQLDGAIRNAVVGKNNLNCVDDNYNSVCRVYEVIVTNKSNMSAYLDGYIRLDAGSNPNLKWALIDYDVNSPQTKPELLTEKNSYSEVTMVENVKFGGSGSEEATQKYYVVVWISETEEKQYDTGEFTGEITFEPTKYTSYVLKKSDEVTTAEDNFLGTSITRDKIHSINFIDTDDIESLMGDASVEVLPNAVYNEDEIPYFDVSILEDDSVKLYYKNYIDENGNNLYDVMIGTDTGITLASSGYYLFSYLTNMESIVFANEDNTIGLDTSKVTTMEEMFRCCIKLEKINVSNFDTSNVTSMKAMFGSKFSIGLMTLTEIEGLDKIDTSNVTNMIAMFQYCSNLTSIDVSEFNTARVINMRNMFRDCHKLTSLDLSSFDTSKVTDMKLMFTNSYNLTSIDVSDFDTSNVIDMSFMFGSEYHDHPMTLTEIKGLEYFDTSRVTTMYCMFQMCVDLTNINVSNFNTSNVTDMNYMFNQCSSLTIIDVSSFDTSKVTNMGRMFQFCSNLETIYASETFNTSIVTDSTDMFYDSPNLVGGSGTTYDSSHVDKTYAKVDGGASVPGYFTLKSA